MLAEITVFGWIFMLGSNLFVVALNVWCFHRELTLPPNDADDDTGGEP